MVHCQGGDRSGCRTGVKGGIDGEAGLRLTKLIHGGLRYVKQLEFGMVREAGRERASLFEKLTPGARNGKWTFSLGLGMYDSVGRGEKRGTASDVVLGGDVGEVAAIEAKRVEGGRTNIAVSFRLRKSGARSERRGGRRR